MKRILILPLFAALLGSTCVSASDINPLGLYIGAGAGPASDAYTRFGAGQDTAIGWKVDAGLRPLPFLGAELEYIDFGNASFSGSHGPLDSAFIGRAHATAEGLFAVGYLPIPLSTVDVFAKLGVEQVRTSGDGTASALPGQGIASESLRISGSESSAAYGAGVQLRLRSLALRAEYERTDTSFGHPALLSFGANWTF